MEYVVLFQILLIISLIFIPLEERSSILTNLPPSIPLEDKRVQQEKELDDLVKRKDWELKLAKKAERKRKRQCTRHTKNHKHKRHCIRHTNSNSKNHHSRFFSVNCFTICLVLVLHMISSVF